MIKYLRINAVDPYEIGILDLVINLETNSIESGSIIKYKDYKEFEVIPIAEYCKKHNLIYAKVVDNGRYESLDENFNVISDIQSYVPEWINLKYNQHEGYGDYIDFKIDSNCKIKQNTGKNLIYLYIDHFGNCKDYIYSIGKLTILKKRFSEKPNMQEYIDYIDKKIETLIDK